MVTFTSEERLALLFTVLGDDLATAAFNAMNPTRATYIRQLLHDFKSDPPSEEEIEFVIADFNRYFQFAMKQIEPQVATHSAAQMEARAAKKEYAKPRKAESAEAKSIVYFPKLVPSNDPIGDLNRLDPFQVASAIEDDHPKTIAMVLGHMSTKSAAQVLELLPAETRSEVVVFLTRESTVPLPIVNQVLRSTVLKAISVEFREEEVDQSIALAELMRSLTKDTRVALMAKLQESDAELASKVKSNLYLFSDVLRMDDRDVQKLLAEVESDSLIVALQRTEQELVDKLLNNLSKRARESITEEMQYKTGVSDEQVTEARKSLVAAIARLDESGDIKLN